VANTNNTVEKGSGEWRQLVEQAGGLTFPFWMVRGDRSVECTQPLDFAGYVQAGYQIPEPEKSKPRRTRKKRASSK
jgi:hypothetical protein